MKRKKVTDDTTVKRSKVETKTNDCQKIMRNTIENLVTSKQ